MTRPVVNYIISTMVAGSIVGAGHGVARGWREMKRDVPCLEHMRKEHFNQYILSSVMNDAAHGCIAGPWFPVVVPAAVFGWRSQLQCDWLKRTLQ